MKKIVLLAGVALSLCTSFKSEAQVRVNIQIGAPVMQQSWYANDDDYYYMPDQGVYYNVRRRVYVYPDNGRWVYANNLPPRYGHYTYANSRYHRVRARAPFNRNDYYRNQYGVAYNGQRGNNGRGYDRRDNDNNRGWNGNGNVYGNGNGNENRDYRNDRDNRDDRSNGDRNFGDRGNNGNSTHYNRR